MSNSNNDEAFNAIVKTYYEKILAYCSYFLKGNRAEDCTQDIFLILYNNLHKLRDYEKIGSWLYKTAGNITKQYMAVQRRERQKTVSLPDEGAEDLSALPENFLYEDTSTDPEEEDAKIRSCTESIMGQLKKGELAVWTLAFRDKQSIRAVAAALDISESAAKSRINRLRHKILDLAHDLMKDG
ncbi:RNA polymerase sigma factor [Treponema primitia]|uniref:RNA polymerase sigma factor n=1 Tax=Treponema primitia TaxID=88058 RepID=UPI00025553C9|nr:sigma-70 family RNA polymerase sigma factor [Treponema primitia]